MQHAIAVLALLAVTACGDFTPVEKRAVYDPQTATMTLPHPCPDWSHNSVRNYDNSSQSNFGCSVDTNAALQLDNPRDWHRGHGDRNPDTEATARVVERYRAGEIPAALVPQQGESE